MRRADLATRLIFAANARERRHLLDQHRRLADEKLADEIRSECYAAWTTEPVKAQRAAAAMQILSQINDKAEIKAVAFWVKGISNITKGKFEVAAASLDKAAGILKTLGRKNDAAQAQVAKLLAVAMLGRYDEAIRTGRSTLNIFVASGDNLGAGKIEMNLSNIVSRMALHREAEKYCLSARRRFIKAGEKSWQAMAENGLANTYAELNEFRKAERFYQKALYAARFEKMIVTEAEIEASLGNLALLRGRYADALRYLELSRQKYDDLGMPHQSAIADLEIADIYAELNLLADASEIYERVSATFRKLKLRAEEARARLNYGRTASRLGDERTAQNQLRESLRLFNLEKNRSGEASAMLAQAELEIGRRHYGVALKTLTSAATFIRQGDNPRHVIGLKLLQGEALLGNGDQKSSEKSLVDACELARKRQQSNSIRVALNLLGKLSLSKGERATARSYFSKAIAAVEGLRSQLAADEFSIAFLASRLEPYENLARLLLGESKFADAFKAIERGRSRSLLDVFGKTAGRINVSPKLQKQMSEFRAELNFYYKKFDRTSPDEAGRLKTDIQNTETKLANVIRQINSVSAAGTVTTSRFDLKTIQDRLGNSRTLIEFIESDGAISAFVISGNKIDFVSGLGTTADVSRLLEDLHFQFGALRYGASWLSRFARQMKDRTDRCLMLLYHQLLRPIEKHLSGKRLVIVPVGPLNYVPFHALHDGGGYLIERFEISHAPSAAVWAKLQEKPSRRIRSSLLMAYADERIPLVEDEIRKIKRIVPNAKSLVGRNATFAAFADHARNHDLIHLACHGQFRPDNPMFSNLHLADGWVTVQDICSQKLKSRLVTLSACETGLSKIFAGDEILGLARGFLSAGAASLVVSLWTVNDAAASILMTSFYTHLQRGASVAASLRNAQLEFTGRGEHPFLWSPFISIGR